ncbi:MAG TPA: MFS transporter [Trebonia sp.]|nr:MFS transporter [Trebonia sp.]
MQLGKLSGPRASASTGGRDRANSVALAALCLLLFLTFLDNTVVSVGLGSLQTDLQASVTELQWVIGAYALAFASIMLACGMIGDELGRKKVMLTGAGVFCAGSVLCALAPDPQTLIAGRAVMGFGAAASEPGTLSVIRHIYTDSRERAWAIGIWAAVSGLALALGPVVGGVLVGAWSWRGIFWFNLVFGLAALIAAAVTVPESSDPTAARVDTLGTIFGAGAIGTLMFAIVDSEESGFGATEVIVLLCAAVVLAVAFAAWERRAEHPLLDLRFLRLPRFTVPNIVAFCTYLATFAIFFFTALYLVEVVTDSGYQIALVFLPMTVLMIIGSLFAGYWTGRTGPRWPITIGCAAFAAGLLIASPMITQHPDYAGLSLALGLAGIGIGITVVPVTAAVLDAVPPERSGMAASAANTSREIGAVAGASILGSLVFSQLNSTLNSHINALHVSAADKAAILAFKPLIIQVLETGQIDKYLKQYASQGGLIAQVENAAYAAFGDGLRAAFYLSAGLVIFAGLLAAFTLGDRPASPAAAGDPAAGV